MAPDWHPYVEFEGWEQPGPAIPIQVIGPNGTRREQDALIDSGSEWSALPVDYMSDFAIRKEDCQEVRPRGAPIEVVELWYEPGVRTIVLTHEFLLHPYFTSRVAMPALSESDFFREFRVTFDYREQQFRLDRYEEPAPPHNFVD